MDIGNILRARGGIARTSSLLAAGLTRAELARSERTGAVRRIRRGWYATADVPPEVVRAVRCGGRVGCTTALHLQGVWTIRDARVHVSVDSHGRARPTPGVVAHWRHLDDSEYPMEGIPAALEQHARFRPLREVVVATDSALNRGLVSEAEVLASLSTSSAGRRALRHVDGASQSGLESLARLALGQRRIGVRSQVRIPGVGFVDLLIGDRLVLELDGETWHSSPADFERDRSRDAVLVAEGYLVLRCSYRQVMETWDDIEATILTLVRRREHLWRVPHESLGHLPRSYRRSRRSVGSEGGRSTRR